MNYDPTSGVELRRPALIALLCVLALAWIGQAAAQQPLPRSEYLQTEIDLGRIDRGAQVTAAFEIRNVGDEPLEDVVVFHQFRSLAIGALDAES